MPPILAFTLCIIFVLWLLTLDRKCAPDNSLVLWLPTVWVLLIASRPLGVWFPSPSVDGETGSPLDRTFLIALMLLGFLILFKRRFVFANVMKNNIWLILLAAYMLLSTLWSKEGFATSFIRWVREMPALIMAFILLTEKNPREAMLSVLRRTTYILIPFSILLIKYYPLYGVSYSRWSGEITWGGVTSQKNGLGRLCIASIFFLIWSLIRRWREGDIPNIKFQTVAEMVILFMSLFLLKGPSIYAMSATAVVSLTVGLTAFVVLLFMNKSNTYPSANAMTAIIAVVIILGIVTVFTGGATVGFFTDNVGRDTTLTGRTDVWRSLLPFAMKYPVLGHGYGAFWTSESRDFFQISGGHSAYLDLILDLGFVGLILVAIFLFSSCCRAQQLMKSDFYWGSLWFCFLLMAVIHSMSESSIVGFSPQLMAMLIFFAISSSSVASAAENSHAEVGVLHNDHSKIFERLSSC